MDTHLKVRRFESDRTFLNSFFDVITISYTSRLKAPGSNPLNNSGGGGGILYDITTVCLGLGIYPYSMFSGFEPEVLTMAGKMKEKMYKFLADSNQSALDVQDAFTELQKV